MGLLIYRWRGPLLALSAAALPTRRRKLTCPRPRQQRAPTAKAHPSTDGASSTAPAWPGPTFGTHIGQSPPRSPTPRANRLARPSTTRSSRLGGVFVQPEPRRPPPARALAMTQRASGCQPARSSSCPSHVRAIARRASTNRRFVESTSAGRAASREAAAVRSMAYWDAKPAPSSVTDAMTQ
jgi:hypothetical protein